MNPQYPSTWAVLYRTTPVSATPAQAIARSILAGLLLALAQPAHADFATWISANVPAVPSPQQGEGNDPDLDGIPNVVEYLVAGMNPAVSDAHLMPAPSVTGSTLTYTVSKRAGIDGVTAAIQVYDIGGDQWLVSPNVTQDAYAITLTQVVGASAVLARLSVTTGGGGTLNPIEAAYPAEFATYYQWTGDQFAWAQEYDVTDYGAVADGNYANSTGTDNHTAFVSAMAAASAWATANGKAAIVRVPAGVYYISDHLLIPPGVVLRGDDPAAGDELAIDHGHPSGANPNFDPPSKLVFPKYTFSNSGSGNPVAGGPGVGYKRIYSDALAQIDDLDTAPLNFAAHGRIGLVNLDINRAAIILDTPDRNPLKTGAGYSGKAESLYLPPFLTPGGVGKYFIVFGIKSNNAAAAMGADGVNAGIPATWQNQWQRNPWIFNANIRILSGGYALVANNQINYTSYLNTWSWGRAGDPAPVFVDDSFEQDGYLARMESGTTAYALTGAGKATFRHTNQYAISLNGLYFFAKAAKAGAPADAWGNENGWYASATSAPWLFCDGHAVVDNWIYSTMGAKTEVSGNGLRYSRNVIRDSVNKSAFIEAAGLKKPSNGSAFLSRGVLMGGADVVSSDNYIITTKHNIGNPSTGLVTSFVSNDGEGLMIDNTTSNVYGWTSDGNVLNANIFAFKTKGVDRMLVTGNDWILPAPSISSNGIPVWIDANPQNVTTYALTNSTVSGNTNMPGTVIFKGGTGSANNQFTGNVANGSQSAQLSQAAHFSDTSGNSGFTISFTP